VLNLITLDLHNRNQIEFKMFYNSESKMLGI